MSTRIETLDLKAEPSAPSDSRSFVRKVCSSWAIAEERIDTAALLASELVTNALEATLVVPVCTELQLIGVRLVERQDSFVIEVWDTSPQPPRLIEASKVSEHGRGLQLVNALSIRWGYCDTGMGSKVVWCELSRVDPPTTIGADNPTMYHQITETLRTHFWNEHT
jgi:anti-sigma regulatory factor (Ser/Thr protein kinase)